MTPGIRRPWLPSALGLIVSAILGPPAGAQAPSADPPKLVVSHRARSLQPGEVVLLAITSPRPLLEVRAEAFDRAFPCWGDTKPGQWFALVGIDLETLPGEYLVHVTAADAKGGTVSADHPLKVALKRFPTRSLSVDEKYVSPPKDVLARIQEEGERVRTILAAVSAERHWAGRFVLPVPGRPISEFGKRSVYNGQPRSPHAGTDFAGRTGTPVKAPNAGRVVLAGNLYFSGNTVILDHGLGLYSQFGHLSAISVNEGDMVARGGVVGKVGATGVVTGPHLHWSVRLEGTRVDPLSLVHVLRPPSRHR